MSYRLEDIPVYHCGPERRIENTSLVAIGDENQAYASGELIRNGTMVRCFVMGKIYDIRGDDPQARVYAYDYPLGVRSIMVELDRFIDEGRVKEIFSWWGSVSAYVVAGDLCIPSPAPLDVECDDLWLSRVEVGMLRLVLHTWLTTGNYMPSLFQLPYKGVNDEAEAVDSS